MHSVYDYIIILCMKHCLFVYGEFVYLCVSVHGFILCSSYESNMRSLLSPQDCSVRRTQTDKHPLSEL